MSNKRFNEQNTMFTAHKILTCQEKIYAVNDWVNQRRIKDEDELKRVDDMEADLKLLIFLSEILLSRLKTIRKEYRKGLGS